MVCAKGVPQWTNFPQYGTLLRCGTSCPQSREAFMSETFNLDQVAGELNSKASGSDDASGTARLDHWLASLVHRYGSDLLLVEGAPPCIRKDGEVRKIENAVLDGGDIEAVGIPCLSQECLRLLCA